jgi:hypothetical protein
LCTKAGLDLHASFPQTPHIPRPCLFPELIRHVAVNPAEQVPHVRVGLHNMDGAVKRPGHGSVPTSHKRLTTAWVRRLAPVHPAILQDPGRALGQVHRIQGRLDALVSTVPLQVRISESTNRHTLSLRRAEVAPQQSHAHLYLANNRPVQLSLGFKHVDMLPLHGGGNVGTAI